MKIQPKPTPAASPTLSPRATTDSRPDLKIGPIAPEPAAAPRAVALPTAPTLPPHVWENRTFAEMPDRTTPEWGRNKPQLTVKTDAGELAKIPKHPAQMTEGELMERYFDPAYKFDTATGKSTEPFFTQPGRYVDSPTRETPAPQVFPSAAVGRTAPGLWGGGAGLWGGAAKTPAPVAQPQEHKASLESKPDAKPEPAARNETEAPLLPHERAPESRSPPQVDPFAGFEGWGRNAARGGGNDYYGSDWD